MNATRFLSLVLVLAAVALAFIALRPPPPSQQATNVQVPAPSAPPGIRVIGASRNLTPGTLLNEVDLTMLQMEAPLPDGVIEMGTLGLLEYRGALIRRNVSRGQVLTRDDVLQPGERGFLAAVLRPGYRAISIGVDATTGAAGLISPGDIVDLVLVQSFDDAPLSRRVLAETVLTRLRVLAADQQVTQGAAASASASSIGSGRVPRTVTLEVTAEGAERVAVAEQLGRLSVTVRSALEAVEQERPGATVFGSNVSGFLGAQPPPARMTVIQGGESQEVTFR